MTTANCKFICKHKLQASCGELPLSHGESAVSPHSPDETTATWQIIQYGWSAWKQRPCYPALSEKQLGFFQHSGNFLLLGPVFFDKLQTHWQIISYSSSFWIGIHVSILNKSHKSKKKILFLTSHYSKFL